MLVPSTPNTHSFHSIVALHRLNGELAHFVLKRQSSSLFLSFAGIWACVCVWLPFSIDNFFLLRSFARTHQCYRRKFSTKAIYPAHKFTALHLFTQFFFHSAAMLFILDSDWIESVFCHCGCCCSRCVFGMWICLPHQFNFHSLNFQFWIHCKSEIECMLVIHSLCVCYFFLFSLAIVVRHSLIIFYYYYFFW